MKLSGAQIGHHQVAYKTVASLLQETLTNYNGPLATAQARIHVATYRKVAKYEAILALKFCHHQVAYKTVASRLQVQVL
eukprot:scaffold22293_cov116-Skeletonema_menzelii.AAC.1